MYRFNIHSCWTSTEILPRQDEEIINASPPPYKKIREDSHSNFFFVIPFSPSPLPSPVPSSTSRRAKTTSGPKTFFFMFPVFFPPFSLLPLYGFSSKKAATVDRHRKQAPRHCFSSRATYSIVMRHPNEEKKLYRAYLL